MQNNCSGWPAQHDNNAAIGLSFFICDHMRSGEKLDPSVVINSGIRVGLSLEALHLIRYPLRCNIVVNHSCKTQNQ